MKTLTTEVCKIILDRISESNRKNAADPSKQIKATRYGNSENGVGAIHIDGNYCATERDVLSVLRTINSVVGLDISVSGLEGSVTKDEYPFIFKAATTLWYDNGMINRFEPEQEKIQALTKWLIAMDDPLKLQRIEADLDSKDLETICGGEESEALALISEETHDFIGQIFDEEYDNA